MDFDIYTTLMLPAYAVGFLQVVVMPHVQSLLQSERATSGERAWTTVALSVVVSLILVVTGDNGFSVSDVLQLAAPGALGASGLYGLIWKRLGLTRWLQAKPGVTDMVRGNS